MTGTTAKSKKKKANKPREIKFVNISSSEASGNKPLGALSSLRQTSNVYVERLGLNEEHEVWAKRLYENSQEMDELYSSEDHESQQQADMLLKQLHLDKASREMIGSKWTTVWVDKEVGKGEQASIRKLYGCICGYDHERAGAKKRTVMMDYTGCLAHIEITYLTMRNLVLRIRGYPTHNEACLEAKIVREPAWPLHPSVLDVAARQLANGAQFSDMLAKNIKLQEVRGYEGMPSAGEDMKNSPYRWQLSKTDSRSIYRIRARQLGVDIETKSHINIHQWLDINSPNYNRAFAEAICHYAARTASNDRLEIIISTKEMRDAAWKYGKDSQIILDGTFGVSSSKLLLFIVMAIDNEGHGAPLAFLLFSAPAKNRFTAAGYNNEILTKLLSAWKKSFIGDFGAEFEPRVGITDTDVMERKALVNVFPNIWLLICRFHLRQAWTNHLNASLKGSSPTAINLRQRMRRVEEGIITAENVTSAREIIAMELGRVLTQRAGVTGSDELEAGVLPVTSQGEVGTVTEDGAIKHLEYLRSYWTTESLWPGWSNFGRRFASELLKCPIEGVLTTTNHLESFNGVLKRTHLRRYQRNDHRLRIDQLVSLLVLEILPGIYKQRSFERRAREQKEEMMKALNGGAELLEQQISKSNDNVQDLQTPIIAYITPDEKRDAAAEELLGAKQIGVPTITDSGLTFACYSSLAVESDTNAIQYEVRLTFGGRGECSCPDFQSRGGACKHMRAAIRHTDNLREKVNLPIIPIPTSKSAAIALHARYLEIGRSLRRSPCKPDATIASTTGKEIRSPDHVDHNAMASDLSSQAATPLERAVAVVNAIREVESGAGREEEEADDKEGADGGEDACVDVEGGAETWARGSNEAEANSEANVASAANEFDFSVLRENGHAVVKAGLDSQTRNRVLAELKEAAPKLGLLGRMLQGTEPSQTREEQEVGRDCAEKLSLLLTELLRISGHKSDGQVVEHTMATKFEVVNDPRPSTPQKLQDNAGKKRNNMEYDIIAPSPEKKKQKRQKSYSTH